MHRHPPHRARLGAALVVAGGDQQALQRLDVTEEPACDHCGAKQFRNWSHARTFEKYRDMPMKLRESSARIEEFDATLGLDKG